MPTSSTQAWPKLRDGFFAHPKISAASVWAASMFSLLIPTCIVLVPLGNQKRNAQEHKDKAQDTYDQSRNAWLGAQDAADDAKQRVIDLKCAINGYEGFNQAVVAFANTTQSPEPTELNKLNALWLLRFDPDKTQKKTSVRSEQYLTHYYSPIYKQIKTESHPYDVRTTVTEKYNNIVKGTGPQLPPLKCGHYSRSISAVPSTYKVSESPHLRGGTMYGGGTVTITYTQDYGSRLRFAYLLDDKTTPHTITVQRKVAQETVAEQLNTQLFKFFAAAIAAFHATGANYPDLQARINQSIPFLVDKASKLQHVMQLDKGSVDDYQAVLERSDAEFQKDLSLWLPLFFLVPPVLAVLTYFVAAHYQNKYSGTATVDEEQGTELKIP